MKIVSPTHALLALALALTLIQPHPAFAEAEARCKVSGAAKLPVVMEGYRASVPVTINGKDTRLWLDSGAFYNFMPKAKAVELALPLELMPRGFEVTGIGGSFTPEYTKVHDFGLAGVQLHNMEFVVGGSDPGNGFIGANLLGVFDTEFDIAKGAVNLFQFRDCSHASLAYWATPGMSVGEARLVHEPQATDHHIYVEVSINGHVLSALLDTGAPTSIVGRRAAEHAGIDMSAPQVVASYNMSGSGTQTRQAWIARAAMISIGGEDIRNSPIRVIDDANGDFGSDAMILGMDFLMAHHVLVSQSQRKMYLTYNGGPIFSVTTDGEIGHLATRSENMGATETVAEPTTADQFAGRGSTRLTRNDVKGAIGDLTAAIRLAPGRADLLSQRASAYLRDGEPDLAAKDIDAALAITPADHRLLTRRAQIRLRAGNTAGALADADAAAMATPKGSLDVMPVVVVYERLGKADRGLALLDPVIDLHRDDSSLATLLNARSWNRALANADLDRALRDIDTAIRKSGNSPAMIDTRALVQFRRKDFAAAIADANAALAKSPKLASSLYTRGLAHLAGGDDVAGKTDLAAARALRPSIDQIYAGYGLVGPGAPSTTPAQPQQPDGEADEDDQ